MIKVPMPLIVSKDRARAVILPCLPALVSFLWVPSAVPRSLRGRPSQVKGAFGVATRWRTRHPGPASLHGPSGQHCGQAGACPPQRAAPPKTPADLGR